MAVSSEFAKTVQEKNVLRTRIMLKDSLLVDKSFSRFSELLNYALAHDVEVWMTQDDSFEQAEKPWTLDLMNYELTALVNDFTKEHVDYVKQIIREIYKKKGGIPELSHKSVSRPIQHPTVSIGGVRKSSRTHDANYETILCNVKKMERILRNNEDAAGNRRWLTNDIEKIRKLASGVVTACENIQKRK